MRTLNNLFACAMALVVPLCTWAQTEIEPNNGSGTATVLTYNTAMTGRMGVCSPTDNSTDYFKIVNLPQGRMRVQSTMSNTGPVDLEVTIQVRQTTTSVIGTYTLTAGANGVPVNDSFVFPCQGGTGNYYFSLLNPSTTYCTNYTFTLDAIAPVFANDPEPNNGGSSAVPTVVNTWREGQTNFYYGDNADYFRMDLPTNGVLNIEWEAEHAGPAASTATVILRNTLTAAIQTWTLPVGANGIPATSLATLTCRGNTNYYLLSISSNICGASYRFRYTVTAPVFANDPEPNSGTGSAVPVPVNTDRDGQLDFYYGDNADYYRLDLPSNGLLTINWQAEHAGATAGATATVYLRQTNSAVIQSWTVPVGANSSAMSSTLTRLCMGNTAHYYLSVVSNICGASYRLSYNVTAPVFGNDAEPNNTEGTSLYLDLDAGSAEGNINHFYDTSGDQYNLFHNGGQIILDISAEHFGPDTGYLQVTIQNHQFNNTLHGASIPVGPNSIPIRSLINVGPFPPQGILVILSGTTCGTSYKFHCRDADNDGTCNAFDLCAGGPEPGTPCNDNNACTINDVIGANCTCAGTFEDSDSDGICNANDNCPNLSGQIGGTCDDGDDATSGDVITANCVCAGTLPNDCNGTPGGPAQPGTSCNDNNPCTDNDVFDTNCACAGTVIDTDGDGTGDCSDGCPADPDKVASGTCGCGIADTDSDGDATADCIDGCPADPDKIAPGTCGCGIADTDSDGDLIPDCNDNCPNTPGVIGSACNDNNANTENDVVGDNCICAGTLVTSCTQNLTIEFQTDANPGQITWEIRQQGSNTLVASGSPIAPSGTQTMGTCVSDGCYYLKVLDSGADGIAGGGYILRTAAPNAVRIIDNRNNFTSGGLSQIAGGEGFCFPVGNNITQPVYTSCDKLDWVTNDYLVCSEVPAVSAGWTAAAGANESKYGYEFWFYNPNGGYSYRRYRSHDQSDGYAPDNAARACHMKVNNWAAANQIPANVLMNVRIRSRVNNVNFNWGPCCRFKIDPVRAACPLTKLMDIPGNQYYSCGVNRMWGTGNFVHARNITGANKYQFRFRKDNGGFQVIKNATGSNYFLELNWTGSQLQVGSTYEVEVRISKDNGVTWCIDTPTPGSGVNFTPWGDICTVTIVSSARGGNQNSVDEVAGLRMYPNPNRGDQLYLQLDAVEEGVQTVSIDIYDTFGKRVSARTIAVQDGFINTVLDLDGDMASGLYMVGITAGNKAYTERLVIQK